MDDDDQQQVRLSLSRMELYYIISFTNEALEMVDEREFQTRTGAERVEARALIQKLKQTLAAPPPDEWDQVE